MRKDIIKLLGGDLLYLNWLEPLQPQEILSLSRLQSDLHSTSLFHILPPYNTLEDFYSPPLSSSSFEQLPWPPLHIL